MPLKGLVKIHHISINVVENLSPSAAFKEETIKVAVGWHPNEKQIFASGSYWLENSPSNLVLLQRNERQRPIIVARTGYFQVSQSHFGWEPLHSSGIFTFAQSRCISRVPSIHRGQRADCRTSCSETSSRRIVTLAFDAAYWGESEGTPRGLENPTQRAEDICSAVTYMQTFSDIVDPERIGVLGICASGGYAPFAAHTDPRMKAVATVSAICSGRVSREGLLPYEVMTESQMHDALAHASKLRMQEYTGEEVSTMPLFPADEFVRKNMSNITTEGWDYYKGPRGQHPRSLNEIAIVSASFMGNYYSYDRNWTISPRPLLMIVGTKLIRSL